ncbi:unnamed protein product, partial [Mesorhabditis belari]|uniref:Phospholipid/glycerol acyltransferase domain-containing protein n=1 Tax=Mesorhabditis belari TaxID=2138241 RepID=A0AAF3FIP1_9BILA
MLGASISPAEGGVQVDGKMGTDDLPATQNLDFRRCIAFIGGTYFLIMTTFIIPVACFASCVLFLFPLMFINMNLFNKLEQRLCRLVNDHWVTTAYYCGVQVREYGTDVSRFIESKCLYLANHLGLVDHFVVMTSLHNRGNVSGSWMWVIYNIWKFTPLGAMWTLHGNFFVNGGPNRKAALLETFKKHLKNFFAKHNYSWIIMYPEGSRLYLIRESAASFAKKNGLQPLQHCTYPRTGAAHAVLEVLGPQKDGEVARKGSGEPVKYIIDATLGYPKGNVVDIA